MSRYPTKLGFILSNRLPEAYVRNAPPPPPRDFFKAASITEKLVCYEVVYFLFREAPKYTKLTAVSQS